MKDGLAHKKANAAPACGEGASLGIPSVVAGYSYAGPPLRLGYLGLGVVTVFIFMGPVMVGGAYFVVALRFAQDALAASVPIGLLAAGIMHVNDVRDYDSGVKHGKRTLATLTGRNGASHTLAFINGAAYLATVGAVVAGWLPRLALVVLVTIPRALAQIKLVSIAKTHWTPCTTPGYAA